MRVTFRFKAGEGCNIRLPEAKIKDILSASESKDVLILEKIDYTKDFGKFDFDFSTKIKVEDKMSKRSNNLIPTPQEPILATRSTANSAPRRMISATPTVTPATVSCPHIISIDYFISNTFI